MPYIVQNCVGPRASKDFLDRFRKSIHWREKFINDFKRKCVVYVQVNVDVDVDVGNLDPRCELIVQVNKPFSESHLCQAWPCCQKPTMLLK